MVANTTRAVLSSLSSPPAPVNKYVRDPKIESYIDSTWNQSDRRAAGTVFEALCKDFATKEIVNDGANTAAIAAGFAV